MLHIDLDDGLNGDWLANLRKMKKAKSKKELEAIIKKAESIKLVSYTQDEVNKFLGKKSKT